MIMKFGIFVFIVGLFSFVGGWTGFFNYDPTGEDEAVSWRLEAIPCVIFLLMGKSQRLFKIFVCLAGIFFMIWGAFEIWNNLL